MAEDQAHQPVGDSPSDWGMFPLSAGDPPTGGSGGGSIVPLTDVEEDTTTGDTTGNIAPETQESNLLGDPPTGGSGGGGGTILPGDGGDTSTSG